MPELPGEPDQETRLVRRPPADETRLVEMAPADETRLVERAPVDGATRVMPRPERLPVDERTVVQSPRAPGEQPEQGPARAASVPPAVVDSPVERYGIRELPRSVPIERMPLQPPPDRHAAGRDRVAPGSERASGRRRAVGLVAALGVVSLVVITGAVAIVSAILRLAP